MSGVAAGKGLACPGCGYDIAGLKSERFVRCPECGWMVDRLDTQDRPPWPRPLVLLGWLSAGGPVGLAVGGASASLGEVMTQGARHVALAGVGMALAPVIAAFVLTRRHLRPHEWWVDWVGLSVAGVALSAAVAMVGLAVVAPFV